MMAPVWLTLKWMRVVLAKEIMQRYFVRHGESEAIMGNPMKPMRKATKIASCLIVAIFVLLGMSSPARSVLGEIQLYAGGDVGDGVAASQAALNLPTSVQIAPDGKLYIFDKGHNRIRVVNQSGIISTVVGRKPFDNNPASAGNILEYAADFFVDSAGNLFVSHTLTKQVLRLDSQGAITQVIGSTGPAMSPSDIFIDKAGNMFIADATNYRVWRVDAPGSITAVAGTGFRGTGSDSGIAVQTPLDRPDRIWIDDKGNLYISELFNHRVRKVDASGIITTVAGNGNRGFSGDGGKAAQASLNSPKDIVTDKAGNLYFIDQGNYRIRKVDTHGMITTVAKEVDSLFTDPGGIALSSRPFFPEYMAIDTTGALYVSEPSRNQVRRINLESHVIEPFAGGWVGDGNPAQRSYLSDPSGMSTDALGNLFVADKKNNRIRKVDARSNIITTVAGKPLAQLNDGAPATQANVLFPADVAVDASGNVVIAVEGQNRIRKVDPDGVIHTLAGGGWPEVPGGLATQVLLRGPGSVALDKSGRIYFSETYGHRVMMITADGKLKRIAGTGASGWAADNSVADGSPLNTPTALCFDAKDNLYILDAGNFRVVQVDTSGVFHNVAGTGRAGYSGEGGLASETPLIDVVDIAVDASGLLYVAEKTRVRRINRSGRFEMVAGGGTGLLQSGRNAREVGLGNIGGIVFDQKGTLFVAEKSDGVIWQVAGVGRATPGSEGVGEVATVAGNGLLEFTGDGEVATRAGLNTPNDMVKDDRGNLLIADTGNHRIRKVDSLGVITTVAGDGLFDNFQARFAGDGGPATRASLYYPRRVAPGKNGVFYIADTQNHRIRKVDVDGTMSTVAGLVTDGAPAKASDHGGFSGDGGPATRAELNWPYSVVQDRAGNLFIADTQNHRIRRVDTNGIITTVAGNGQGGFSGDGGPATEARLSLPSSVLVDTTGVLFIVDTQNHRIRRVDTDGVITTIAGNHKTGFSGDWDLAIYSSLSYPSDLALGDGGNLYISDTGNARIRHVDRWGMISTVAGNGGFGAGTEGLPGPQTSILPIGIFVDQQGTLFFADRTTNTIRKMVHADRFILPDRPIASGQYIQVAPSVIRFDTVRVGQSAMRYIDIINDEQAATAFMLKQVVLDSLSSPFHALSDSLPVVVPPGSRYRIQIQFSPQENGFFDNQVLIISDDIEEPQLAIEVQGQGYGAIPKGEDGLGNRRVTQKTIISPGGFFKIHFDTEGTHAVALTDSSGNDIPDYIDAVALTFDHVRSVLIDTMRFQPPPPDGDDYYDIYVLNLGLQYAAYGITYPIQHLDPTTPSYIEIDNDFSDPIFFSKGLNGMRVTAAHNFCQAVLYGYDASFAIFWWREVISTWIEDVIYDDVNDYYQYLTTTAFFSFFSNPALSLDKSERSHHPYGASVFAHYLTAVYGFDVVRKSWQWLQDHPPSANRLKDINASLPGNGFPSVLPGFVIWNYFTGSRARTGYYKEASAYPEMPVKTVHLLPESTVADSGWVDHLASNYIRVPTKGLSGTLRATFQLSAGSPWALQALLIAPNTVQVLHATDTQFEIASAGQFDEVVFTPVNLALEGVRYPYQYSMSLHEPTHFIALDLNVKPGDQAERTRNQTWVVGDTVAVDLVALSGASGNARFQVQLQYNSQALSFASFELSDLTTGGGFIPPMPKDGKIEIHLALLDTVAVRDSGSLGVVKFKIEEGFSGETTVTLVSAKFESPVDVLPEGARITLTGELAISPSPDFDADGVVGFGDFLLFAQHFGFTRDAETYDRRFDLDADGIVGFGDFLLFAQHFGQDLEFRKTDPPVMQIQSTSSRPARLTNVVEPGTEQGRLKPETPLIVKATKPIVIP